MKSYLAFKSKAITLRKTGLSYNEIQKEVPVAKSTLSLWLKAVPLKKEHKKRLYTKQINILSSGPRSQRERRKREVEEIIRRGEQEIALPLSLTTYRLVGAALYWAEGSKGSRFEITNSDPYFILFTVRWIEKVFSIPARHLRARLNIYPQQNELKIKKFWSDLTGIPVKNFGKTFVKPANKGYKKNNLYYGTMRIEVPKGTDMRHRVFGWMQAALKDIEPTVQSIKRKWLSLAKTPRPVNLTAP
ncbi:MAG: hypothetical protein HY006_01360 [Candidatus Sungbacteria bacterium]|nr:hypothetical protein [Candidatus Sungbacteria bacterium]